MNNVNDIKLLGIFDDEECLIKAANSLVEHKIEIYDFYTPFPVHGLDELLKIKRSRLPYVTFMAALFGCFIAFSFQIWTSKYSWPINVGGKPFNSFMAFIPVGFEITVLLGALVTVGAFFYRCGLFPGKSEDLLDSAITNNKFVLAVEHRTTAVNLDLVTKLMEEAGALEVRDHE